MTDDRPLLRLGRMNVKRCIFFRFSRCVARLSSLACHVRIDTDRRWRAKPFAKVGDLTRTNKPTRTIADRKRKRNTTSQSIKRKSENVIFLTCEKKQNSARETNQCKHRHASRAAHATPTGRHKVGVRNRLVADDVHRRVERHLRLPLAAREEDAGEVLRRVARAEPSVTRAANQPTRPTPLGADDGEFAHTTVHE